MNENFCMADQIKNVIYKPAEERKMQAFYKMTILAFLPNLVVFVHSSVRMDIRTLY
jgi:hypothetical protein